MERIHQTNPINISHTSLYLIWNDSTRSCWAISAALCGNQGGVFTFQDKDFVIFLSGFGATLRLAVLSWFAAQLVEGRKTATSSTSFGIFSFLCSSFKSYFHNLASRIYHLSLGFGLIVMNINTESLSEVWLRPLYAFYETASGHCLNLLFFLPLFVLSVETLKGADGLSSLSLLPPLWGTVNVCFLASQRRNSINAPPDLHCSCWKPVKSFLLPDLAGGHLVLVAWAACGFVKSLSRTQSYPKQ